ncbi:hypothetical protein RIF29_07184 [Crotalaria pallida]|uniref:Uncharacterized protein n=1 Tax=Crotalaria pallida TaxID=3830 RepID=A0AAN9J443_CROPI
MLIQLTYSFTSLSLYPPLLFCVYSVFKGIPFFLFFSLSSSSSYMLCGFFCLCFLLSFFPVSNFPLFLCSVHHLFLHAHCFVTLGSHSLCCDHNDILCC